MGDKIAAKQTAKRLGIPVVPGSDGSVVDVEEAIRLADDMGYPVLIKAASGGGGKGMQVVHRAEEMARAFSTARAEASSNFGDSTVYIENISPSRATSRCRFWATAKVMPSILVNATALCSAAIRRSGKRLVPLP